MDRSKCSDRGRTAKVLIVEGRKWFEGERGNYKRPPAVGYIGKKMMMEIIRGCGCIRSFGSSDAGWGKKEERKLVGLAIFLSKKSRRDPGSQIGCFFLLLGPDRPSRAWSG